MRLLNTHTHKLEFFVNPDEIPPYTILSHTWGDDEVTFKDLSSGPLHIYKDQAGGRKILEAAAYAARNGWEYIWIDTCCIDKSDITELSEAINSMFRWYERADVCYAYLSDVPPMHPAPKHPWRWSFRSSRWFTRGWTLQELLAPTFLEFLDRDWNLIGSRDEWATEVELATGIEVKQLANFQPCSIATKLSWAANRQTTRIEDRAYSLLGLLGINMPLIYGEGERAFTRLQHELIRSSNDESIFAWGDLMMSGRAMPVIRRNDTDPATGRNDSDRPVLARSPKDYQHSRGITTCTFDKVRRGFSITNAGLSMNAEVFKMAANHSDYDPLYLVKLNCSWAWPPLQAARSPLVLFLRDPAPEEGDPARVPLFYRKIYSTPQTWSAADGGGWQSLGRHDILIANDVSLATNRYRPMEKVAFEFETQIVKANDSSRVHTYRLATCGLGFSVYSPDHAAPRHWYFESIAEAPKTLAENEAFIYHVSAQGSTGQGRVGYLAIVKWNRWARLTLSYGVWLHTQRGSFLDERVLTAKLNSDRNQPYPVAAPVLPEFAVPGQPASQFVTDTTQNMALKMTTRSSPRQPAMRRFFVTFMRQHVDEGNQLSDPLILSTETRGHDPASGNKDWMHSGTSDDSDR